jgi:hypothetical protein
MLVKKVCKNCISRLCPEHEKWTINDDHNWERGFVLCAFQMMKDRLYLGNEPPKACPFILEHMVNQKEIANA